MYFIASKTGIQSLKGEVRVALASVSGFLLYHLAGKSEESRGENRIPYCWVLLLILHTLPLNIVGAVHTTQEGFNMQLIELLGNG